MPQMDGLVHNTCLLTVQLPWTEQQQQQQQPALASRVAPPTAADAPQTHGAGEPRPNFPLTVVNLGDSMAGDELAEYFR